MFVHWIFANEEQLNELCDLGNAGLSWCIANPFDCGKEKIELVHNMGLKVCLRAADSLAYLDRMKELGLDYFPSNCMHDKK